MPTFNADVPILVVDDDEEDFFMIEKAIRNSQIMNPVLSLPDGRELMDYFKGEGRFSAPESAPFPGLIFLDLNMPRMDGREALKAIKADSKFKKVPVVVLSTSRAAEDVTGCYGSGANTFVSKPDDYGELLEIMKTTKKYWLEIAQLPS